MSMTPEDEQDLFDDMEASLNILQDACRKKTVRSMRDEVLRVVAILRHYRKKHKEPQP